MSQRSRHKCSSCGAMGRRYDSCPCPKDSAVKFCIACEQKLPVAEFYRRTASHDGLGNKCKPCWGQRTQAWRRSDRGKTLTSESDTIRRRTRKAAVLAAYGGACECCGETRDAFLTIDHVRNDGAEHRRSLNGSIYPWLLRNNCPRDGYRLLCMNCNFARGKYGICPHESERIDASESEAA